MKLERSKNAVRNIGFGLIDKIGDIDDLLVYLKNKGVTTEEIYDYSITNKDNFLQKLTKNIYKLCTKFHLEKL